MASEGKRKSKAKAKVTSPIEAKTTINQPLSRSATRRLMGSLPARRSNVDSETGPPEGADRSRDDYDPRSQRRIESETGEGEEFSIQEEMGDTRGKNKHRRIAERAFLLYAEGGFQHGHDLDHWLEAEREIMNGR
jgi:hypothetical protein